MKILVLNGSPKHTSSVTVHYVLFLQKKFPQHEFSLLNISREISKIEGEQRAFQEVVGAVQTSDAVLWAFPVYTLLVHAHYKRFIELIWERGAADAFRGKYAAVLTTSIHFSDHTAHNYINAICDDLGMKYVGSYSAEMYDLLKEEERNRLIGFAEGFFDAVESGIPTPITYPPLKHSDFEYVPGSVEQTVETGDTKVLILTDVEQHQTNLKRMVERFCNCFAGTVEMINLHEVKISGGCRGCVRCGPDGVCVYRDVDGIHDLYSNKVAPADVLVFAGAVKDRYLSSRWKLFFDRGFFNNFVPSYEGKQLGFVISGPLRQLPNLRQVLEGYAEMERASPVGFVTDESADSGEIDRLLESLAMRLVRCAETGYIRPPTFLGVGGRKIFRDQTWGGFHAPMRATDRHFKKHGFYDFPKRKLKDRIIAAVVSLTTRIPNSRQRTLEMFEKKMVEPLEELLKRM